MGLLICKPGRLKREEVSCQTYIRIISCGLTLQFLGMGFNNYIRTAGAPTRALLTMVAVVVVSTSFNVIFVLWLKLGVAGSASATLCGQATSCLLYSYS
jgi:Na+-driven multidrug efflux pump